MNIMLDSLTVFHEGGVEFTLPSKLAQYIEFYNVVVFLLDENGQHNKVVGVKFSQAGGINHYYIAWEFQDIDRNGKVYPFTGISKMTHKEQELVYCTSWSSVGYFLNPDTGEIVDKIAIR
ncbi:hypothetical protein FACS1894182_13380 [Bacteroidia bacterium]|nr:hypothetical protein FACS1894182_13380 [Bacteroidia bacterium]